MKYKKMKKGRQLLFGDQPYGESLTEGPVLASFVPR